MRFVQFYGRFPQNSMFIATALCLPSLIGAAASAGTPATFTEEAVARGIDFIVEENQPGIPNPMEQTFGRGIAFADLNGSGSPDIIATGRDGGLIGIFENDGSGHFTNRSATSGIPLMPRAAGVSVADYDSDGDLDLYITAWNAPNKLLRNDGDFTFTDVTADAGAGLDDAGFGMGSAWGDYDGDGLVDLYVCNYAFNIGSDPPNLLFRNLGNGQFESVGEALGVADIGPNFQPIWFDFDRDGDLDLHISSDKGSLADRRNRTWENVGGEFVEVTDETGTPANVNAMGVAVGDFDGNLFEDLYITNTPEGNVLYLNNGDETFSELASQSGTASYALGWGALFWDCDNDGSMDLYVCNALTENRMYQHGGAFPCDDNAQSMGIDDDGRSFCVASADVDGDGDLDLLLSNQHDQLRLYINNEGQNRNWAKFNIAGAGMNTYAIGARVNVKSGGEWRTRTIYAGSNYKSQNDYTLHFGLDTADLMENVLVYWPDGHKRSLKNYPANYEWTIPRKNQLGDMDGNGVIDSRDMFLALREYSGSTPGSIRPGGERADLDSDGDVDMEDIQAIAANVDALDPKGLRR